MSAKRLTETAVVEKLLQAAKLLIVQAENNSSAVGLATLEQVAGIIGTILKIDSTYEKKSVVALLSKSLKDKADGLLFDETEDKLYLTSGGAKISEGVTISFESGLNDSVKNALLNCFAHVAWTDENGQSYYNALETALNGGTPTIKYSIINNLTNATTDNETSLIEAGKSYIAHISADSGYHIDSISCTMGGEIVDITDNTISIESVTGNIVITAIAVEDSDLPFVSGEPYSIVWHADKTLDSTTGEENDYASFSVSDFISVKGANRIEGVFYGKYIYTYDANKNFIGKVGSTKGASNGDIVYYSIYGDICYIKVENRTSLLSTTYVIPYIDPVLTETTVPQNDTFYSLPNIEVGTINNGQETEGSSSVRCGYANCLSATTLKNIAGGRAFVYFYDAEKNYISYSTGNAEHGTEITVPENAQYFRITEATFYGYPTFVKVVK